MVNLVWFATLYVLFVTGTALPLTLLRFTDDTRLIAFVTSIGGLMGIVIGPLCNFISDRLWTSWGRRRPFLLVAMAGTFLAMALTPYMPSLVPLVLLTVISSLLGDMATTFEPLWLEIVPTEQRGRAFAMRSVLIQLASLFFYQVMFAQWDKRYQIDLGSVGLGLVKITGEQVTYFTGALVALYVIFFVGCLVREVRPEGVELKPWGELDLNPVRFTKDFFLNVFGDKRWWPIYIFYSSPGILSAGTGTFMNLLQVSQWKYDKQAIALMGLPWILITLFVAAPILARQSDSFKRHPWWALVAVIAAGIGACWSIVRFTYPGLSPSQLPPLWALMGISLSIGAAAIAMVCLLTQELNRITPSQNRRLWPWFLGLLSSLLNALFVLYFIRVYFGGHTPPIAQWFLVYQTGATIHLFHYLSGPLLYEFLPNDKIGTIMSGGGLINTAIGSIMGIVIGFWVYYFSTLFGVPNGPKDYSSYLLAILVTGPVSVGLAFYFFRLVRKGKIIEFGRLRLNSDGNPVQVAAPEEPELLELIER